MYIDNLTLTGLLLVLPYIVIPLVVFFDNPGWEYMGLPVAFGSLVLILIAWLFHRLPPRVVYPTPGQDT